MESFAQAGIVFLGGGIGAVLRWGTGVWVSQRVASEFPWATLGVNLVGSMAIGLLAGLMHRGGLTEGARLFWIVGILGGFTTFSAFSLENAQLLRDGHGVWALANIALQVGLGLGLAALGFWTAMPRGPQ